MINMTTLSLELPPELYERLAQEAKEVGDSVQVVAQRTLEERFGLTPASEREQVWQALQLSGLLTELGPEMTARAERSTASLEEVQAAFDHSEGKPQRDCLIEMRGPKG